MPIILKQQHKQHVKDKKIQEQNIRKVLSAIKQQSLQNVDSQTQEDIFHAIKSKQQLIYELMLLSPLQYIAHQFTKLKDKNNKVEAISNIDLLTKKFTISHQLSKDNSQKINIKNEQRERNEDNIFHLKQQLKQKLSEINENINSVPSRHIKKAKKVMENNISRSLSFSISESPSKSDIFNRISEQQVMNMMQFKQPRHWIKNNQKTEKIRSFLQNYQKQHKQRRARLQQSQQFSLKQLEQSRSYQAQVKQQKIDEILRKGRQKLLIYKQKRSQHSVEHQSKIEEIDEFLQNISSKYSSKDLQGQQKRLYKLFQQRYSQQLKQQQQRIQQKLQRIKQGHRPFDRQQMDEFLERYQKSKQQLLQQKKIKKQEAQNQRLQINEQLKNLFKGRRYKQVAGVQNVCKVMMDGLKKMKNKKKDFSKMVQQKFKPNVNLQKRQQLQQSIRQLQRSQDKSKRKVFKNGQVTYQDKVQIDQRKLGIQNLHYLKKYLQGRPRKQRPLSTSVGDIKQKKIDYLRQNRPNIRMKGSLVQWKKVMEDGSFDKKDKYTFLKESISTLEHKALQKEIEARNLKKSKQQLEKKEMFDQLYLESIEAKMAILNNLMLKN